MQNNFNMNSLVYLQNDEQKPCDIDSRQPLNNKHLKMWQIQTCYLLLRC